MRKPENPRRPHYAVGHLLRVGMLVTYCHMTTCRLQRPVLTAHGLGTDDGGSGTYTGIGQGVWIEGYFIPEDAAPGVAHAEFLVLGRKVE